MEVIPIQTQLPRTKRGEMLLVRDPSSPGAPTSVPVGAPAESTSMATVASIAAMPITAAPASIPAEYEAQRANPNATPFPQTAPLTPASSALAESPPPNIAV